MFLFPLPGSHGYEEIEPSTFSCLGRFRTSPLIFVRSGQQKLKLISLRFLHKFLTYSKTLSYAELLRYKAIDYYIIINVISLSTLKTNVAPKANSPWDTSPSKERPVQLQGSTEVADDSGILVLGSIFWPPQIVDPIIFLKTPVFLDIMECHGKL